MFFHPPLLLSLVWFFPFAFNREYFCLCEKKGVLCTIRSGGPHKFRLSPRANFPDLCMITLCTIDYTPISQIHSITMASVSSSSGRKRCIGIVREVYNKWERRAPLTPIHVQQLTQQGIRVVVQPSTRCVAVDVYIHVWLICMHMHGACCAGSTRAMCCLRSRGGVVWAIWT